MDAQTAAELYLVALCNWREAQNQSLAAKVAQAWTIRNRALQPGWWGKGWVSVVTKPLQFSSFNATDPNSRKWPEPTDPSWADCWTVASEVYGDSIPDPTFGATHYFDMSLDSQAPVALDTRWPVWAKDGTMEKSLEIDRFRFYRLVQK